MPHTIVVQGEGRFSKTFPFYFKTVNSQAYPAKGLTNPTRLATVYKTLSTYFQSSRVGYIKSSGLIVNDLESLLSIYTQLAEYANNEAHAAPKISYLGSKKNSATDVTPIPINSA